MFPLHSPLMNLERLRDTYRDAPGSDGQQTRGQAADRKRVVADTTGQPSTVCHLHEATVAMAIAVHNCQLR